MTAPNFMVPLTPVRALCGPLPPPAMRCRFAFASPRRQFGSPTRRPLKGQVTGEAISRPEAHLLSRRVAQRQQQLADELANLTDDDRELLSWGACNTRLVLECAAALPPSALTCQSYGKFVRPRSGGPLNVKGDSPDAYHARCDRDEICIAESVNFQLPMM